MAPVRLNFHVIFDAAVGTASNIMAFISNPLLRGWYSRRAINKTDVRRQLPGDDLVLFPKIQSTLAITIRAQPSDFWPFLLDDIQNLELGSSIHIHPWVPTLIVDSIKPRQRLILVTRINAKTGYTYSIFGNRPEHYVNNSWVFVLEKLNERDSRLIVRWRFDYDASFINTLLWRYFRDPAVFVAQRKMLLNIKHQVESKTQIDWHTARRIIGI